MYHFLPQAFHSFAWHISFLALGYFISISFLALGYFISISFLALGYFIPCPGIFHSLPWAISLLALGYFIPCPGIFHSLPWGISFLPCTFFIPALYIFHSLPSAILIPLAGYFIPWHSFQGHQEGGHMTNFQKRYKLKVVALLFIFWNLLESCSKVLLLWRYDVKHFSHRCIFFCFFLIFSMKK